MKISELNDPFSMACALYAALFGVTFGTAKKAMSDENPITTIHMKATDFYKMANAAIDHIEYLPSRVAARKRHAQQPPYMWLEEAAERPFG